MNEIEVRAGCGHVTVLLDPKVDELLAMTEGPCPGCAFERMDCGLSDLEDLIEKRKDIFTKYDGRRRRLPMKGTNP